MILKILELTHKIDNEERFKNQFLLEKEKY